MRVLIIGGTRFIGRHLVGQLKQLGHEVTVFHRGQTPLPTWFEDVKVVHGDRKNPDDLLRLAGGEEYDVVVDTVIYTPQEAEQAVNAFRERTGHYIMISTGNVYKLDRSPAPHRETDELEDNPEFAYGYNKRRAEDVLFDAYRECRFPAVTLRMPSIYGPYDYQAREWYFIKRLLDGRTRFLLPDGGMGVFHREYAGNIAAQLILLMSTPASLGEAYNAGHRHFQTCFQMIQMAGQLHGSEIEIYTVPRNKMPWPIALCPGLVYYQPTDKLESLGYQEHVDLRSGWKQTFDFYQANPVSDWQFQRNSQVDLFDYANEDKIMLEQGSLVSK